MRWFLIDRFIEFQSGRRAKAIKNVTLAEEYLHDHFPGYLVLPNSLVIEGMGQTAMFLACEAIGYSQLILLAKVASARFDGEVVRRATRSSTRPRSSRSRPRASRPGLPASARASSTARPICSSPASTTRQPTGPAPTCCEMARWMRILGVFTIGVAADGAAIDRAGHS